MINGELSALLCDIRMLHEVQVARGGDSAMYAGIKIHVSTSSNCNDVSLP